MVLKGLSLPITLILVTLSFPTLLWAESTSTAPSEPAPEATIESSPPSEAATEPTPAKSETAADPTAGPEEPATEESPAEPPVETEPEAAPVSPADPVTAEAAPQTPTTETVKDDESEDEEEDEVIAGSEDESVPDEEGKGQHHLRFSLFGAGSVPATGERTSFAVGGNLGYDLWDYLGIELWLSQTWGKTSLDGATAGLKIIEVKPGLRYRFYDESFRAYIMGHVGFVQTGWAPPGGTDRYDEGAGVDVGAGIEYKIYKFLMVDLFVAYEGVFKNIPQNAEGKLGTMHGLFAGIGLGVSIAK